MSFHLFPKLHHRRFILSSLLQVFKQKKMSSANHYEKFIVNTNKALDIKVDEQTCLFWVWVKTQSLQ